MHAANDNAEDLEAAADRLLAAVRPAPEAPDALQHQPDATDARDELAEAAAPDDARFGGAPDEEKFLRSKPAGRAVRDLDALGRWLPMIEGSALPLFREIVDGGPVRDGRPDTVDRASGEFARAVSTLRLLEGLAPRALAVLWFAFVATGAETRDLYEQGEVRVHLARNTHDVKPPGGWFGRVALVAATAAERADLLTERSHALRETRLRARGTHLLAEALRAFVAARSAPRRPAGRLDLARMREGVERIGEAVDRAVVAFTRARSKAPQPRRPPPRAAQTKRHLAAAA